MVIMYPTLTCQKCFSPFTHGTTKCPSCGDPDPYTAPETYSKEVYLGIQMMKNAEKALAVK